MPVGILMISVIAGLVAALAALLAGAPLSVAVLCHILGGLCGVTTLVVHVIGRPVGEN